MHVADLLFLRLLCLRLTVLLLLLKKKKHAVFVSIKQRNT